jgi:AbrB family looped-hinge helix DNA binding protein
MTVTVKGKDTIVIPPSIRKRLGIKSGDKLEIAASGNVMTIRQKPDDDDDYTPAQRKVVDAEIAKGVADIRSGRFYGPFDSTREMMASIESEIKKRRSARRKRRIG